jgi:hypothetical protein
MYILLYIPLNHINMQKVSNLINLHYYIAWSDKLGHVHFLLYSMHLGWRWSDKLGHVHFLLYSMHLEWRWSDNLGHVHFLHSMHLEWRWSVKLGHVHFLPVTKTYIYLINHASEEDINISNKPSQCWNFNGITFIRYAYSQKKVYMPKFIRSSSF